jgi:hypothetical protein
MDMTSDSGLIRQDTDAARHIQEVLDELHQMQELKVWGSFINLPHRQTSDDMPMLSKCLLYPFKNLSLPGILFSVTEKHSTLR